MLPLVQIEDVSLFIPGDTARELVLRNINLEIFKGGHLAVLGANGSGKSTLLRLLHGDLWPASGSIRWNSGGKPETSPIVGRQVTALVSPLIQENCQRQAWNVTVLDMLENGIAGEPISFSGKGGWLRKAAMELLEDLDATRLAPMRLPTLSQGQLRLALLGRALLAKPGLLLLDEWADGLDERHKQLLSARLKNAASEMTMVFASHRADGVPEWCARGANMLEGRLIPGEIAPQIVTSAPVSARVPPISVTSSPDPASAELISLGEVSVYVDRALVLRDITWQFRKGENWSISGPNGSGKSTFLRLLAGREFAATGGWIKHFDLSGRPLATSDDIARNVALVSDLAQATYGYPINALELVCSGFDECIGVYRAYAQSEIDLAMEGIRFFFGPASAREIAGCSIRRMSSGQLRKLFLARAFVRRPAILLLDEALSGLDAHSRKNFLETLDMLALTGVDGWQPQLVFVSHYGEDEPACVNRHATMKDGRLFIEE